MLGKGTAVRDSPGKGFSRSQQSHRPADRRSHLRRYSWYPAVQRSHPTPRSPHPTQPSQDIHHNLHRPRDQVRNQFTGAYGPPFDHFIMMVKLDGHRWLCDVGFGSGFQLPLSLETDGPQVQSHGVYRLRSQGNLIFMEMKSVTEESGVGEECWTGLYKFTLEPRERDDFRAMCGYHQSSASSIFFCKSLCSLLLPTGRITIMGRRLIITSLSSVDGQQATKTTTDLSDEEITELLREKFGIVLHSPLTPKDVEIIPPPVTY
uniref:arylamine N-acetyltransferase n=1 Tax=Cyprinus carpio carpio TaxID=630221 RepID=A0A9J7ZE46_CYPCA